MKRIRKAKEQTSIKIRKQTFEQQKREAVNEVKKLKEHFKNNLQGQRAENYMNAQYKKQQIHEQKKEGYRKMNEFVMRRREAARREVDNKANEYRNQIMDLEKEGDDLEKLETELLRKLQETQK